MKNDDQWFEPGDKVVRVTYATMLGLPNNGRTSSKTEKGKVLAVEYCHIDCGHNMVKFVGVKIHYYAACFRKVEEIQLCVRAAEAMKKPKKQEEMA